MKRAFAVSLMVAVVATSLLGPAEAAKKKKPKKPAPPAPVQVDATYFLRRDGECGTEGATYLSLVDAPDVDDLSCGNLFYGVPAGTGNAQFAAPAISYVSRAGDGIPMTLDATKDVTGMIGVKSRSVAQNGQGVRVGVGKATLNVELTGITGDGEKLIGATAVNYDVTPGPLDQIYKVEFTIKPDAALDKSEFTSLKLTIWNSGNSLVHGFYTTDNPASFFKIGTWQ